MTIEKLKTAVENMNAYLKECHGESDTVIFTTNVLKSMKQNYEELIKYKENPDFVEVKHGEWILRRQSNGVRTHQCSVCGRLIYSIDEDLKDYAPYCHC